MFTNPAATLVIYIVAFCNGLTLQLALVLTGCSGNIGLPLELGLYALDPVSNMLASPLDLRPASILCCAGERRLHVAVPLFMAAVALAALAASMQLHAPKSAFCALMAAVLVWAPDAVMASWPATFLQVHPEGP